MDSDEHSGRIWSKLSGLFGQKEENLEQDIIEYLEEGELNQEEGTMLLSVLEFDSLQVHEIMTPRTDIDCLPLNSTIKDVAQSIIDTGHSRLPIFEDTKDNIIGIAYAKDLLPHLLHLDKHEDTISPFLRTAYFVPETKICSELFQEFRTNKNHIAIVVDEYGGTSGLVTIEDLIEVIVGEIEDEHDAPKDEEVIQLAENSFQIQGRTFLEDLEKFGINISSEEVDTIGGYLCLLAGKVPLTSEEFDVNGWHLAIEDADAKQVKTIVAKKVD